MSRIYQDGALRNKAVRSARLPGWDPAAHQGGNGVLLEGELVDVSRHSILDAHGRKERYYVLYIRPSRIHRRKFNPKGDEIEPNFSATRKVNTGFLMSSYNLGLGFLPELASSARAGGGWGLPEFTPVPAEPAQPGRPREPAESPAWSPGSQQEDGGLLDARVRHGGDGARAWGRGTAEDSGRWPLPGVIGQTGGWNSDQV
ncbi:arpin isoform X3 [Eulemur rufifrons]|uniref:arpin isoform X3 n=1 Tax=Eulemur rufifrons TaxID=859984 RepID=UPI003742B59A